MANSGGIICPVPKGNYDATATYQYLNFVLYNGSSYICKAETVSGVLPADATKWQLLAAAGTGGGGGTYTGTSSTAAATSEKAVATPGTDFVLAEGARILVSFTNANTAANPTLNIDGTGAHGLRLRGAAAPASAIGAGVIYEVYYDGAYYQLIGGSADANSYDNGRSGLTAADTQSAIDELAQAPSTGGSTVTVTTNETTLRGRTVEIRSGQEAVESEFDNTGTAVLQGVPYTGTVTISASDGTDTAASSLNIPYFGNYSASLSFWAAPITITTADPELYNKTLTVSRDGTQIGTVTFDSAGEATYPAESVGAYTFTLTYDGDAYSETVNVTEAEPYTGTIRLYTAEITVTTPSTELYGQTITVTHETASTAALAFSQQGQAIYRAHKTGVYTFTVTYNGADYYTTVNVTAETAYTATIILQVKFAFRYSENDSNPASVTYPAGYDNSGWSDTAYMDFANNTFHYGDWNPEGANAAKLAWLYPKSCMLKYDGTVDYYLDENDETKKADGAASDVANMSYGGNAMMEWGQDGRKIYWKIVPDQDGKGFTFVVANDQAGDADLMPWNHYNCQNQVADHFYTPKYFGSSDGTRLRSISGGTNYVSHDDATETALAQANNPTSDKIWNKEVYADWLLVSLLDVLISKSTNTQAKFGTGVSKATNTAAIGQGTMNGKGMFWGKNDETSGVKTWGMENLHGNLWRRTLGLINDKGTIKAKLTYGTADGSTVTGYNQTGSGYLPAGTIGGGTSGGYISHMNIGTKYLTPNTMGGSKTTHYCDGGWFNNSQVDIALVGGRWSHAGLDGGFCCNLNYPASLVDSTMGAAISCKPLAAA